MRELKTLIPYFRPYRRTYLAGLALVIVSNAFSVLVPRYVQHGIDAIALRQGYAIVLRAVEFLLGAAFLSGVARFGMRQYLNSVSRRVEYDLRNDVFAHLERQPAAFFDRHPTGDLMARATNDLLNVRMVAGPALMYLVDTVTRAALLLPAMLQISPVLTGYALLPLLGLPFGMILFGRAIHARTEAIQAHFATITSHVMENLSGVRIVRAYRQESAEEAEFSRLSTEYVRRNLALVRAYGAFQPMLMSLGGLGAVIVLLVGGRLVIAHAMSIGAFVAFGVYLTMLVWPMIALGWVVNLVQRGAASMGRVNMILHAEPTITSPAAPATLPPAAGARALTFEHVWFRYPGAEDRGWVLQDISFTLAAGESLGIVGATGAGKSTLVDLVARTYDPDRGRILVDGVDIRDLTLAELRRTVSHVPQETFLFSESVRDNVLFGMPDDGRLERASEAAQLTEALPSLPDGYDTLLGERGVNLSGGQKQRTAIARALAKDAPIFLLDDALSAVDASTEARILKALRSALIGRTTIIVSHRLAAVRDATRIIVLDRGTVVETGRHADLIRREGRYWELVRRQELEGELEGVREGT
ncbi:MAG TPA: ABC transporter ATP-binding protein [Gemmatimonadales bacterium]|nr:ABC transporter ATP-binding protein [Gemmatimonadales bacterium]